jgi:hypothetical protein
MPWVNKTERHSGDFMRYSLRAVLFLLASFLTSTAVVVHAQNNPTPDNPQTPAQTTPQQKPSPDTYPSQQPANPPAQNNPAPDTTQNQNQTPAQAPAQNAPQTQSNPPQNPDQAPEQNPSAQNPNQAPSSSLQQNPYSQPLSPAPGSITPRGSKFGEPWEGEEHYGPLSRMSVGADVGPMGIGVKGAVILTGTIDGRVMGSFFNFNSANFEAEGTTAHGSIHLASLGAMADFYPKNSIFRISGGLLLWNGNQITASGTEAPGSSFTINNQTYYSANPNTVTGATPVSASAVLGLHSREPEFIVTGGFGRFVPRSQRHWSFPSEFGVVFMGAPSLDITPAGWVCTNAAETACSSVTDTSTPVGAEFNSSLQSALARWRRSLSRVTVYPIFTYSVVYSFNLRGR